MAFAALVPVLLWTPQNQFVRAIFIGAGIVLLFGLVDDLKNIGYKAKFAGHMAAALVVILYGGIRIKSLGMLLPHGVLLPDWVAIPLTLLVIVGVTNAINLADGLDGLAAGMCLLTFLCLGYLAYRGENMVILIFSVAMVGAIFGFLRFNTYPATLFMGDAGSTLLGFLAVTLALALTQQRSPFNVLIPLLLLGFPVLDTLTVISERIAEGRSPFVADKNHFHHKLLRLGLYHTEAVFLIYVLQAVLVTCAFLFRFYSEWFLLLSYVVFSGLILFAFALAHKSGWKAKRYNLFDKMIKGKLRRLREKRMHIRVYFNMACALFAAILVFSSLLPQGLPLYSSFFAMLVLGLICIVSLARKAWMAHALRIALYLFTPLLIYAGRGSAAFWINGDAIRLYNIAFGALALFVILTLKFTARTKGFKISPTDFLILFIALVVPNLPEEQIRSHHLGLVAARMIVLFFAYEVLMGELRGKVSRVGLPIIAALAIITVRGFF